jgi:ubiquitin carboxyl-terminal hydrolase L5
VITNACATQAILSVLLNSPDIDLGDALSEFKAFTMAFDSECKGLAISNSDMIREAHNSFSRSDPFEIDETKAPTGKGHAHHFIAFVPFQESVFELDGLKSGPIHLGSFPFLLLLFC